MEEIREWLTGKIRFQAEWCPQLVGVLYQKGSTVRGGLKTKESINEDY